MPQPPKAGDTSRESVEPSDAEVEEEKKKQRVLDDLKNAPEPEWDPGDGITQVDRMVSADEANKGVRVRNRLARWLDRDRQVLDAVLRMFRTQGELTHAFSIEADLFDERGGPGRKMLEAGELFLSAVDAFAPNADTQLGELGGGASLRIVVYPSPAEVRAALTRQVTLDLTPGVRSLPDTTAALLAVGQIFAYAKASDAATAARGFSGAAADRIVDLADFLDERKATLNLDAVRPNLKVMPDRAAAIVAELDAWAELPTKKITVVGVLEGANSSGEGRFDLRTDDTAKLDPALGSRRRPGDTLRGTLSADARTAIREHSLWDTHVKGTVELTRKQRSSSIRIENMHLVEVVARF